MPVVPQRASHLCAYFIYMPADGTPSPVELVAPPNHPVWPSQLGSRAKSVPLVVENQELRSKPRWCPQTLKGNCHKGGTCPYHHLDSDAVANIKAAEKRQNDMRKDGDKGAERGRSPSRDKKGKQGHKRSVGSE